jgi:glutamyl-tRNA reductase
MVVGETQIAGQLKKAYRFSFDRGLCSVKIARAIKYAFKCAAEVRNSTDISSKPVSIASVAVDKAKQALPNLKGKKALIIGAGEMSMITMKHLISHGASVTLINRTKDNAQKMYVEAYSNEKDESRDVLIDDYENLADAINSHELLFTSTASNEPIITDDMIESCDFSRYWFDMAVPRDIVYSHGERINLYQIDDLKTIICENISVREDEAKESLLIVKKHVNSFFDWLQTLSIEPMIKEIYLRGFEAAHDETERVLEKGFIPKEYADEVTKLSEQVIKRFLHDFSERLRQTTDESRSQDLAHSLKYILELEK